MDNVTAVKVIVTLTLVGLAVLIGTAAGLWWLMTTHVGPDVARLWALAATGAVPLAFALGYKLGHVEARGKVAGLDLGVGKVMRAAGQTAGLRVQAARAMRRPDPPPPVVDPGQVVIIPALTPAVGPGNGDDVLLLE